HDVILGDHAHVAVAGFGRMHKKRRRSGAGQRSGDLAADMAGLAHAHHNHAALALKDEFASLDELLVDASLELLDRFDFHADGASGGFDKLAALAHVHIFA